MACSRHASCITQTQLLLFLMFFCGQVYSQDPAATVNVEAGEVFEGSMKVLTCRYAWISPCPDLPAQPDASCTFDNCFWKKGSIFIGELSSTGNLIYYNGYNEPNYAISSMDTSIGCDLTIQSVAQTDSGDYVCEIYTRIPGAQTDTGQATLTVSVLVPPSTITLDYDGVTYNDGGSISVVAGDGRQFTCNTPGVYPQTTFTWTLPLSITTDQPLGTTTSSTNTDGTVDSSNVITVSIAENPATSQLTCGATNKQDGSTQPDISITVTLQIKVPPKEVQLLQSGSEVGGSLTLDQGTNYTLQCSVQGTRPAASIQWLVSNAMPSTGVAGPTSSPSNGLYDTLGSWSLTAARTHHKQEVKCVASTDESTQTYPQDKTTIDVIGPPDTPLITATSPMTEGVSTSLTCTAHLGYPEDWMLVWSNSTSGAPLPGSTTTPSTASGQRYSFTSTLDYTPTRQDNGNTIKCAAQSDSWTGPEPEGSSDPLNVQFCARSVSLTECPTPVLAGNTVSIQCVSESSNPATMLTWYKGDEAITAPTDQPNVHGDHGGKVTDVTYTTDALNKSNNGDVIMCCATNPSITCQDNVCDVCTLNVQYPPEFSQPMQSPEGAVIEGITVALTCSLDANPLPSDITWQKLHASDVPNTVVNTEYNSTLTLENISREQAGDYRCKANNAIPDPNNDVYSSLFTVTVHYESSILNKDVTEAGSKDGEDETLTCIALGNPAPNITWYAPNNTLVTNDTSKYTVMKMVTSGDNVFGYKVTGNLTIRAVDSERDYGEYTCTASNGVADEDILKINLTGTRRPESPTNLMKANRTSDSITVSWAAGYDGGEDQWFIVSHLKTNSDKTEEFSDHITGGENMYTVTGLEGYTEYEIRVYAENKISRNPNYGVINVTTLPKPPEENDLVIKFDSKEQTVTIEGLFGKQGCIELEVLYEGDTDYKNCGECYTQATVNLGTHCNAKSQSSRRKRAGDRITDVRAIYCIGGICSSPTQAETVRDQGPINPSGPDNTTTIIAGVVGCIVLVGIIVALMVYLRRLPQKKNRAESTSSIELHRPDITNSNEGIANAGAQEFDERDNPSADENGKATDDLSTVQDTDGAVANPMAKPGIKRYNVGNGDTYAQVQKVPPRQAPDSKNLPDVIYGKVNKKKEGDKAKDKKKPKKYVPPSKDFESAYESMSFDKETNNGAGASGVQHNSGRTVNEDGLIYLEVGHMRVHPANQPPIQTEESTDYASLDFSRMNMKETL